MSLRLFIQPLNADFAARYREAADAYNRTAPAERNSGFDLFCDTTDTDHTAFAHLVSQGCRAVALDAAGASQAFWLAPRSSICRSQWRLANSLGLIDATYRGPIRAAIYSVGSNPLTVFGPENHGLRLTQLATPSLTPWAEVIVVDELPAAAVTTARGSGGFGSTGTH
jgi:dUTPase